MRKSEVIIGGTYTAKVSGKLCSVKVIAASPYGGWDARNLATGREIRIRGSQRLRPRSNVLGPIVPPKDLITPRLSPAQRGITLAYIKDWRQNQQEAGKPDSIAEFWPAHGLCEFCHGIGDATRPYNEDRTICGPCCGRGLVAKP